MKRKTPITSLSPDERMKLLLAFKANFSHNFTLAPTPSKPIPVASARFATV